MNFPLLAPSVAPGRLPGAPVAIVDIGSNSVRLVVYERLARALTPLFNEKVLCGLGRGVATSGVLAPEAIDKTLAALRGFKTLCGQMAVQDVTVLATAAARDARNGPAFLAAARDAIGADITLLPGPREAELSALGAVSGHDQPDGVVGDLGGGSLELIEVEGRRVGLGVSLPIGGLVLNDLSKGSPKRAIKIVRDALVDVAPLRQLKGRTFHAVGGTWRALAKLHMDQRGYPLHVIQGYVLPADPGLYAELVETAERDSGTMLAAVSAARRPLLAYGAAVLEEIVRIGQPSRVMVSTLGVREGMLFERLPPALQAEDPLLSAAAEFNQLRARSPGHGADLCGWTDALFASLRLDETAGQKRLRHAACLLADVAWRAHPDDRGLHAFMTIVNAGMVGLDHADRCLVALAVQMRHNGLDSEAEPRYRALMPAAGVERARLLAGAMRIAFQLSAAMGGVLPSVPLAARNGSLALTLPAELAELATARVQNRLRQFAKLVDRSAEITAAR